jgi:hypothetical protein
MFVESKNQEFRFRGRIAISAVVNQLSNLLLVVNEKYFSTVTKQSRL